MVYSLTWLPEVLEKAGLKVAEVPEWRSRGRAAMGTVRGVMVHHTAGSAKGNMPTLDLLVKGRPDLAGPLAQLGLGRDGTYYVIAAGRCNHAGAGKWRGVTTGNSSFIGIEAENTGRADDVWPEAQLDALRRGVAAILKHIGANAAMACGHKEFALPAGRKSDPGFAMPEFRERVAQIMSGAEAPPSPIPARDALSRPTLRRGAEGPLVGELQARLGVETLGIFGPKTEAAVRAFQRAHGLVPDGIVGPKTWILIAPADGGAPVAAPAPTAAATGPDPAPAPTPPSSVATPPVPPAAPPTAAAAVVPPPDSPARPVTVKDGRGLTPEGQRFVTQYKRGWVTEGTTSVRAMLRSDPGGADGIAPPHLAIVAVVSGNEGRLEAINSWDAAFLSVGIMQWTLGVGDDPGELPALLARLQRDHPEAFTDCFGRYGIGVDLPDRATTGYLKLDGAKVATAARKAEFRSATWAYRFWRAGHHAAVRRTQLRHAVARIDRFADLELSGHPLRAWLSSELGMALLLDQHINRPGHVPATIKQALEAALAAGHVPADPAAWTVDHEHRLVERYLVLRARTSMTNSQKRANQLFDAAHAGLIRAERGTFS